MKILLVLAALLAGGSAQARVNTQDLSSADAKALVTQRGAVVLSTSSFAYDRFVANGNYCGAGELPAPAYVPTLDSDAAFIGFTCESASGGIPSNNYFARRATQCRDGQIQNFPEPRPNGLDGQVAVARVCSNGKWLRMGGVDPVGPKNRPCRDGATSTYLYNVAGPNGRPLMKSKKAVCSSGRWVR